MIALVMFLNVLAASSTGIWYGKPPLKVHSFDVTLHNPSKQTRWLILPSSFPHAESDGDESELQVYRLKKGALFVRGVSSHFQTVKLPADGTIRLRNLRIESWWDEPPKSVELEVWVARAVTIGGVPLEKLVGDATCANGDDFEAPRDAGDARAQKFWHPTGPAKLAIDVESRATINVPLKR